MIPGVGGGCRIHHHEDGRVTCDQHNVDFTYILAGGERENAIRAHIAEENAKLREIQDKIEILTGPGGNWGAAFGPLGVLIQAFVDGVTEAQDLTRRQTEALERVAHALEERARIFIKCPDCGSRLVVRHDGEVTRHELSE